MSVKVMNLVYSAHFHDIEFIHTGKKKTGEEFSKKIKTLAPRLKSVCLALADHANDEGEGAYPSLSRLEEKTELSRVTVVFCLTAMRHESIIFYTGISKRETCNYTLNLEKLQEMTTWERQKREKPASKVSLPSKATLLPPVSSVYQGSKATLPEPSLNHPLTIPVAADAAAEPGNINPNTGRKTAAKVRGDAMDGVLWGAGLAARKDADLNDRINAFPADCQETLRILIDLLGWQASAIPQKPQKSAKGGTYAQWINELREVSQLAGEFGRDAIAAAVQASKDLTISHPAGISWALPGEVGKLALKKSQNADEPHTIDTPFARASENWVPYERPTYAQILAERKQSEHLNNDNEH